MSAKIEKLDQEILRLLGQRSLSPSHDRTHTDVVKEYALMLQREYGGDEEVLVAAARLHDLGRDDPTKHGLSSIRQSVIHAKALLGQTSIDQEKIDLVVLAIREHDQPDLQPRSTEGRILKDADFLAGFGARGIFRTSMWAGETHEGMDGIIERLSKKMPQRVLGLEFPESRILARRSMALVYLVLDDLGLDPFLPSTRNSKYIVFEGISGSGKDTQIKRLEEQLQKRGLAVGCVREPTKQYQRLRESYQEITGCRKPEPEELMGLLLSTRFRQAREEITPKLQSNDVVLANRSYLSTIVYQSNGTFGASLQYLLHSFAPSPDLVLLFDLEPTTAAQRLQQRLEEKGGTLGEHEQLPLLIKHRPLYRDHAERFFGDDRLALIDAGEDRDDVESQVSRVVHRLLTSH